MHASVSTCLCVQCPSTVSVRVGLGKCAGHGDKDALEPTAAVRTVGKQEAGGLRGHPSSLAPAPILSPLDSKKPGSA